MANVAQDLGAPVQKTFDLFFHVKHDKSTKAMPNLPYRITLDDGRQFTGVTDSNGYTEKLSSDFAQTAHIEVPYHDVSTAHIDHGSGGCAC